MFDTVGSFEFNNNNKLETPVDDNLPTKEEILRLDPLTGKEKEPDTLNEFKLVQQDLDKYYKDHGGLLLWTKYFWYTVPEIYTYGVNHIKKFGTPRSGVKGYDQDKHRKIRTMQPLSTMIEQFSLGASIGICNDKDLKEMYLILHDYIKRWEHHLNNEINLGDAPIEALQNIDAFASSLFNDHAKYSFNTMGQVSGFGRLVERFKDSNKLSLFSKENVNQQDDGERKRSIENLQHKSIGDLLGARMINGRDYS